MTSLDFPRRLLALAIAALAGLVDAQGFLRADGYFVSFMSGNTTRLAVDGAVQPWRAMVPLALIGGFVAGVALGALVADRAGQRRKTVLLGMVAALLAFAALAFAAGWQAAGLGLSVLAMGAVNNAFARERGLGFGLTYMTGALVRLGQAIADRLAGAGDAPLDESLWLWLALAAGAFVGAAAFLANPGLGGWIGAGLALILALAAYRIERRPAR